VSDGSPAFEWAADELEKLSRLSRLEARGTLRIALKEAGLLPKGVNYRSMLVVFERVLPQMLGRRGVKDAPEICRVMAGLLRDRAGMEGSSDMDTPEKVFARMGRPSVSPPANSSVFPAHPPSEMPPSSTTLTPTAPSTRTAPITGRMSAIPPVPPDRSSRR